MSKVVIVPVTGAQNLSAINDNFQTIVDALNEQVLFRDNPSGEPNQVVTDVDMNGKRIYNLPQPISPSEPVRYQDLGDITALTDTAREYAESAEASNQSAQTAKNTAVESASLALSAKNDAAESAQEALVAQQASEDAALLSQSYAESINPTFLLNRSNHTGTQDINTTTTGALSIARGGTGETSAASGFDALKQPATEVYAGVSQFATAAENLSGTVSGKAVDPLGIREAFSASGSAPVFACRAWVKFDGTGTPAIKASGNVSSITDNGVGDYTVNFATPMQDAEYAPFFSTRESNTFGAQSVSGLGIHNSVAPTASALRFTSRGTQNGSAFDSTSLSVAIFR